MPSLDELISEFEGATKGETDELIDIITHSEVYGSSGLERRSDELHELRRLHQSIAKVSEKVYNSDDPDFISALDDIHRIEKKRENISGDIIDFLKDMAEYVGSNQEAEASHMLNEDLLKEVIDREKRARKIENRIESKLLKVFRRRALEQASDIIENDRPHVKFKEEVLQSLLKFAYSETYQDPVLEAFGALRFEKVEGQEGREVDYVIEEFIPCTNYRTRKKDMVGPDKDFVSKIREDDNLVSCHTHPPGGQKSHSGMDQTHSSLFNVLVVPESKNKIWVSAQNRPDRGDWENLAIDVLDGKVPQAHLDRYNRGIKKSLATKEMRQDLKGEYGNWERAKNNFDELADKRMIDDKLDDRVNRGEEKQWLRFVKGEEY